MKTIPSVFITLSFVPFSNPISAKPFSFAAIGDLPYSQPISTWQNLIKGINQSEVSFAVHIGDIKSGGSLCSDKKLLQTAGEAPKA